MQTNYKGIDYGCGQSNTDKETGIRYGVIGQNSVNPEALDDIFQSGRNVVYEDVLAEHLKEKRAEWTAKNAENPDAEDFDEDNATEEFSEGYESDGGLSDYLYEHDGYKLTGCLRNDLFILKSPFFTFAQFCSPCVPGAGNLESPFECVISSQRPKETAKGYAARWGDTFKSEATAAGFPRVFCLGHDWFNDGRAPYPVFSVETGEEIFA